MLLCAGGLAVTASELSFGISRLSAYRFTDDVRFRKKAIDKKLVKATWSSGQKTKAASLPTGPNYRGG